MKHWQPHEVIAVMSSVDPNAEASSQVSFGPEEVYGQPPAVMQSLGEDRRFPARLANSNQTQSVKHRSNPRRRPGSASASGLS